MELFGCLLVMNGSGTKTLYNSKILSTGFLRTIIPRHKKKEKKRKTKEREQKKKKSKVMEKSI